MSRDIVLLFDGTSNQIEEDRTNILRLYGSLKRTDEQLVWYHPGVGTMGMGRYVLRWAQKAYEIAGLAFAIGLDNDILNGYRFLATHWQPGDRISIFGFSRGAYTARALAGFLRAFGLLHPDDLHLLMYAWRAFKRIDNQGAAAGQPSDKVFGELRLYERTIRPKRAVPVHFLGLFDTVASVFSFNRGIPTLKYLPFTSSNSMVRTVRHAVAIDEQRSMFQPLLWDAGQSFYKTPWPPKTAAADISVDEEVDYDGESTEANNDAQGVIPQDFEERWFTGTHGDIGGGWPEARSGLAKIPLKWMIEEAQKAGLQFKAETIRTVVLGEKPGRGGKSYCKPDANAPVNNSMTWGWWLVEFMPRRVTRSTSRKWSLFGWYIPLKERRKMSVGANIDLTASNRK